MTRKRYNFKINLPEGWGERGFINYYFDKYTLGQFDENYLKELNNIYYCFEEEVKEAKWYLVFNTGRYNRLMAYNELDKLTDDIAIEITDKVIFVGESY